MTSDVDLVGVDWHDVSFTAFLDAAADAWGERTAFIGPDSSVTFSQARDRAHAVAAGLSASGVTRGARVGLFGLNSQAWIDAYLGVAVCGAIAVPLNTRYQRAEVEYVLDHADIEIVLAGADQASNLRRWMEQGNRSLAGVEVVSLADIKDVADEAGPAQDGERRPVDSADVVLIQYTSGTTGFPKGAMLSQRQVLRNALSVARRLELDEGDILASGMPFFHVGGSVLSVLVPIVRGATLAFQPKFNADGLLRLVEEHGCTAVCGVQTMWADMIAATRETTYDVRTLRKGWGLMTPEQVRFMVEELGVTGIANSYGLSETSPNVAINRPGDSLEDRMSSCGHPHDDIEVAIWDLDKKAHAAPGSTGEILVRGWTVMQGYHSDPAGTAAAVDTEGWLHTGDLGHLREDGRLVVDGRLKDMLRVGGENVAAAEIENALVTHPAVADAYVVGVPHERLDEVPLAFVRPVPHADRPSDAELAGHVAERLASFKVPRRFVFADEFPTTASGKVQKFKLVEMARTSLRPELDTHPVVNLDQLS